MSAETLKAEVARRYSKPAVVIDLDVVERNIARAQSLCDAAGISTASRYRFWTFGGNVPGERDEVDMHLDNHPDNKMPHNIDLHAVNGQGGGAAASLTAPGAQLRVLVHGH